MTTAWPGVKDWISETLSAVDLDTYVSNGLLHLYEKVPTGISPADRAGVGGAGTSEEWDTSTTGLTWTSSPTTVDSNTTVAGHLYIDNQADTTERLGLKAWAPGSGAFDARLGRVLVGANTSAANVSVAFGLIITDSGNSNRLRVNMSYNYSTGQSAVAAYTYASSSYTQRGSSATFLPPGMPIYLRITRDGSNNCSFYWSMNGVLWNFIATQSFTLTIANIGLIAAGNATAGFQAATDWIRTSV